MPIDQADGIGSTMVDPTVRVSSPVDLELTTTFTWSLDDGHVVTVYVEGGRVNGYSVDG